MMSRRECSQWRRRGRWRLTFVTMRRPSVPGEPPRTKRVSLSCRVLCSVRLLPPAYHDPVTTLTTPTSLFIFPSRILNTTRATVLLTLLLDLLLLV